MDWFAPVLAAVSAVVVALIAALVADRLTLRRLERVDSLLRESQVTGEHRQLLEDVRNRLVERIAYRELRPTLRRFGSLAGLLIVGGPLGIVGWGVDRARAADGKESDFPGLLSPLVLVMSAGLFVFGLYLLASLAAERQIWAEKALPSRRSELPDPDQGSSDDGGS